MVCRWYREYMCSVGGIGGDVSPNVYIVFKV